MMVLEMISTSALDLAESGITHAHDINKPTTRFPQRSNQRNSRSSNRMPLARPTPSTKLTGRLLLTLNLPR
jgi:hypothetical protein